MAWIRLLVLLKTPLLRLIRPSRLGLAVASLILSLDITAGNAEGQPSPSVVTATTGLVTIESDQQKADNSTGVVTATGNVRIVYPDQRVIATARQAQYFSREGFVVLSGDVDVVQDGGNSIRAERLVYLVERERIVADPAPGQQVISRLRLTTVAGSAGAASIIPGTGPTGPTRSTVEP